MSNNESNLSIQAQVFKIFSDHFEISLEAVTLEKHLVNDLQAVELDFVEVALDCEQRFAVSIPNSEVGCLKCVGNWIALIQKKQRQSRK